METSTYTVKSVNYGRALAALTASGITRKGAAIALLGARANGFHTVAGRNSGWMVARTGPARTDSEFTLEQESFVLAG